MAKRSLFQVYKTSTVECKCSQQTVYRDSLWFQACLCTVLWMSSDSVSNGATFSVVTIPKWDANFNGLNLNEKGRREK